MQRISLIFLSLIIGIMLTSPGSASVDNPECFECHSDTELKRSGADTVSSSNMSVQLYVDAKRFSHSVHNNNGVNCVDCHADIEELDWDNEVPHPEILKPVVCESCHEEEGEAFMNSVHMKARSKGIIMLCYACHDYHYVTHQEALSVSDRENRRCLKCHNPYNNHGWLPQKNAHFGYVECTACHTPTVPHQIHLNPYDLVTNKYLTGNDMLKILNISYADVMPLLDINKDHIINSGEFDNLVLLLQQKNVRPIFHAELVADLVPAVHQVSLEGAARDCEQCHAPDSKLFNTVSLVLSKTDGTVVRYEVDRNVLEGYHTSHFYALGGTRIRVLDKVGLALLVGAALFVLGHLTVRIATIPLRRDKGDHKNV